MRALLLTALLAAASCGAGQAARPTASPTPPVLTRIAPADGYSSAGGTWLHVRDGNLSILVAVQAPGGPGPFPVVIYMPGEVGLDPSEVRWSTRLAAAGYLVVLGCAVASDPPPACHQPDPPSVSGLDDLVRAAGRIPEARSGPVGVVGISLGAGAALQAAARREDLAAVVADSPARPCQQPTATPVLLLAARTDGAYGNAAGCAQLLGGTAETQFFAQGDHVVTLSPGTADQATARTIAFLDKHLR